MVKSNHRNNVRYKDDQRHRKVRRVTSCGKTAGFTRFQIPTTIVIIMTLVTVAMGYQRSMEDAKLSKTRAAATRASLLLLEEWRRADGTADFDPVSVIDAKIPIHKSTTGPGIPMNMKEECRNLRVLGSYEIEIEEIYYYVTLFSNEVSSLKPKVLNATVSWRRDHSPGILQGDEWVIRYSTIVSGHEKMSIKKTMNQEKI